MLIFNSHLGDYATATSYFAQLAHLYAQDSWTHLELNMLDMYAHCLKYMSQNEEYIRIGLKIVAKLSLEHTSRFSRTLERKTLSLTDLISASATITHQLTVPMRDYFDNIHVDPYIHQFEDHDGFCLHLLLASLTSDAIVAQEVRVKLVPADEDHQSELWLVATNITLSSQGNVTVSVGTKVCKIFFFFFFKKKFKKKIKILNTAGINYKK